MTTAEILSQGDEVVTGQVVDTNAAWIAEQLTQLGIRVVRHTAVGDDRADIEASLRAAAERADIVISTGGLGPTEDDLTAGCVARVFERPLSLDEEALTWIRGLYAKYGREMPVVNEKQAWLPTGAHRLDNHWGTAPGFAIEERGTLLAFLPGVPREMKKMITHRVLPLIHDRFAPEPWRLVTFRTTGVGESNLQERIGTFEHDHILLSYRTKLPENHIKLRVPPMVDTSALRALIVEIAHRIGSPLFTIEGVEDLALEGLPVGSGALIDVIGSALTAAGETVAVAESCTGGRVASTCTGIAGSSRWFLGGIIAYHNDLKVRDLGVQPQILEAHGAVSEPVARAMAEGIRRTTGATYGLSTTGIAGPSGGTADKPVGTVHIALASATGTVHRTLALGGRRDRIQTLAASAVLDLLRRSLQHL